MEVLSMIANCPFALVYFMPLWSTIFVFSAIYFFAVVASPLSSMSKCGGLGNVSSKFCPSLYTGCLSVIRSLSVVGVMVITGRLDARSK